MCSRPCTRAFAATTLLVVALSSGSAWATAAPPSKPVAAPLEQSITLAQVVSDDPITIAAPDPTAAWLHIEPQGNDDLADRCTLPVIDGRATLPRRDASTACMALLRSKGAVQWVLHHGDLVASSHRLAFVLPTAGQVALIHAVRTTPRDDGEPEVTLVAPSWPTWATDRGRAYANFGNGWERGEVREATEHGRKVFRLPASWEARLGPGLELGTVYVETPEGLLPVEVKAAALPPSEPPVIGPGPLPEACTSTAIRARVRHARGLDGTPEAMARDDAAFAELSTAKKLRGNWFYVICVDLTQPDSPRYHMITEPPSVGPMLAKSYELGPDTSDELVAGKDLVLVSWHPDDVDVTIDVPGSPSWPSPDHAPDGFPGLSAADIADPDDREASERAVQAEPKLRKFSPRAGEAVQIDIEGVDEEGDAVFAYRQVHRQQRLFRGAYRVGLGLGWAPWERGYAAMEGPSDTRFIGAEHRAGLDGGGVVSAELLLGYTFFLAPTLLPERKRGASLGWYVGGGVLRADEDGVGILSSLHTGPELVLSRNYGVALTFSLRRSRWLQEGRFVGQPLRDGQDAPTRFGVTPAINLVLHIQPRFLQAAGEVADFEVLSR